MVKCLIAQDCYLVSVSFYDSWFVTSIFFQGEKLAGLHSVILPYTAVGQQPVSQQCFNPNVFSWLNMEPWFNNNNIISLVYCSRTTTYSIAGKQFFFHFSLLWICFSFPSVIRSRDIVGCNLTSATSPIEKCNNFLSPPNPKVAMQP